jgi:hypothetical protein
MLRTVPRRWAGRPQWWAGLAALAIIGALSIGLMHDWLSWNSARWALGRRAVARGIAPHDIEGGFEWDGWHSPRAKAVPVPKMPAPLRLTIGYSRLAFPELTGRYAIAFEQPHETTLVDAEPYRLWLAPGRRRLLLVRAEADQSGD